MFPGGTVAFPLVLVVITTLGHQASLVNGVKPCEYFDGSGSILIKMNFTESYGSGDHLPTLGEEQSLSAIFGTARQASEPSGPQTIRLRIFDSAPNRFFNGTPFSAVGHYFQLSVRSGTGYISLKQGIDREILNIYVPELPGTTSSGNTLEFMIECLPDDASSAARNFSARVSINDVNDNSPVFYNTSTNAIQTVYAGTIRENTAPLIPVLQGLIRATDKDEGTNAWVTVSALNNTYFQTIGAGSYVRLYTNRPLDYEAFGVPSPTVTVLIVARDSPANASTALSSTATVVFTVLDEDDLPPKFIVSGCTLYQSVCLNPTYTASIVSNVTASGPLTIRPGPIVAVDQDSLNLSTRYSIVEGNFSSSFAIDQVTGQVTQLASIDRRVAATVSLIIKASQVTNRTDVINNNLYGIAVLIINVDAMPTYNLPPYYSAAMYTVSISENSPIGSVVGHYRATDPENDTIRYSLIRQTVPSAFVYTSDGTLLVNGRLTVEGSEHRVLVGAQDNLANRTATAEIRVILVNSRPANSGLATMPQICVIVACQLLFVKL